MHLVGHSYGGGVALDVALARPDRIASLALYEPSAFHLLRQMGEPGAEAFAEITQVARCTCRGIVTGDYRGAASAFRRLLEWSRRLGYDAAGGAERADPLVAQGPSRLPALIENPTPADAYRSLAAPVLILRGEHAPLRPA